jgi:anti-anti-sigma factor
MTLRVTARADPVVQLSYSGDLTLMDGEDHHELLEEALGEDGYQGTAQLDLSKTGYVDSTGISWLVALHKRFQNQGGRLVLVAIPTPIRTLLRLLHLTAVFHLEDDRADQTRATALGS